MNQTTEEFLAHYGVKGMRWGLRKDRPGTIGRTSKETSGKLKLDPENRLAGIRGKKIDVTRLSDQDLKALVNRINTEATYRQLTAPKKTTTQKFFDEVKTMTVTAVKRQGQVMLNETVASVFESRSGVKTKSKPTATTPQVTYWGPPSRKQRNRTK